jgi:lipopolysaccharide/colanic/teichoic acid biosynthesis glycosyltransferase
MKRAFDLLVAGVLLLALAPLFLVAAIAIGVSDGRPIFFWQKRVGLHGSIFMIMKFRTMRDAPVAAAITVGRDPRITPVGHVLRQTKIDELPQLVNVLKGEMSLVGPRPEVPEYFALYPPEQRAAIASIRPGITDRASIAYRNEAELLAQQEDPEAYYRDVILPHKISMAVDYASQESFREDLMILIETVNALFAPHRNGK